MKMSLEEDKEVLGIIAEVQTGCADVELRIGSVTKSGQVIHGGIYIKDCPASVVERLVKEGWVLEMNEGMLHPVYKEKKGE